MIIGPLAFISGTYFRGGNDIFNRHFTRQILFIPIEFAAQTNITNVNGLIIAFAVDNNFCLMRYKGRINAHLFNFFPATIIVGAINVRVDMIRKSAPLLDLFKKSKP